MRYEIGELIFGGAYFRNFAVYVRSFKIYHFLNLAVLLILRRSFQWCQRIFPYLSISKVEKTVEETIPDKVSLVCRVH